MFSVIMIVIGGAEGVSVTATDAGAGMGTGLGSTTSTEGAWPAIERGLVDTACVDSGGGGCDGVGVKLSALDDVAG